MHYSEHARQLLDSMYGISCDKRPSWDEYFADIAQRVARRSTCPRASVGCVLVRDKRILSTGFNGAVAGLEHCTDAGCMMVDNHCLRSVHAEQNAIVQCALHGVTSVGSTAYVTHMPCVHCAKMLINAGVVRVVYINDYQSAGCEFFKAAGVSVEKITL